MKHLKNNVIASIDFETTGTDPAQHEIVQVGIVPLDSRLQPLEPFFYRNIRPLHPDRCDPKALSINGLTLDILAEEADATRVAELFEEWFATLGLPVGGRLIPLAHNYVFEHGFLSTWLGPAARDAFFHYHSRDAQQLALAIKDQCALTGRPVPFDSVSLDSLCETYHVVNEKPHDALADALAEAELYRRMLYGSPK